MNDLELEERLTALESRFQLIWNSQHISWWWRIVLTILVAFLLAGGRL
jgi:hypothetical protein